MEIFLYAALGIATMAMLTPLHEWHKKHARVMHEFAGWDMPIEYNGAQGGILNEHVAVRTSAGIFDVSHMGRALISGWRAAEMLQYVLTNDVAKLDVGQAQYSFLVRGGEGGKPETLDDVYLYRTVNKGYLIVVNAANATKDIEYLAAQSREFGVDFVNATQNLSLIAIQGPKSRQMLEQMVDSSIPTAANRISPVAFNTGGYGLLSTTGYTGEHTRFEAFVPASYAVTFWEALIESGAAPVGLGARNTLRTEAGLLLYGHDINEGISPIEAGMGFAVKPGKSAATVGKQFYEAQQASQRAGKLGRYLVQMELSQPRGTEPRDKDGVPGPTSKIILGGQTVGEITSGTVAPLVLYQNGAMLLDGNGSPKTARRGLAIGYASTPLAAGTEVSVLIRGEGKSVAAMVMSGFLDKRTPLVIGGLQYTAPLSHYVHN